MQIEIIIPRECPLCGEEIRQVIKGKIRNTGGIFEATYGCNCRAIVYKIPGGFRLDILKRPDLKPRTSRVMSSYQANLFGEKEGFENEP